MTSVKISPTYEDHLTYPMVIGHHIREVDGATINRWKREEQRTRNISTDEYDELMDRVSFLEQPPKEICMNSYSPTPWLWYNVIPQTASSYVTEPYSPLIYGNGIRLVTGDKGGVVGFNPADCMRACICVNLLEGFSNELLQSKTFAAHIQHLKEAYLE